MCLEKNISFFCHINFAKVMLPIIAFQDQFTYIHYLAKKGIPTHALSGNGQPLAHKLLEYKLYNSFEGLLKAPDFQINAIDAKGNTLLQLIVQKNDEKAYAIFEKHPHFLSILNVKNAEGETALLIAVKNKHFNLADQLMELDQIDLTTADSSNRTLLHYFVVAEAQSQLRRFTMLVNGQRILTQLVALENQTNDPIFFKTKNPKILRGLIQSGLDLTQTHPTTQETLLFILVRENSEELVRLYCKTLRQNLPHAFVRILNHTALEENRKKSALIIAAENNYYPIVKLLINEGAHFYKELTGLYIFDYVSTSFFGRESYDILVEAWYGNLERALIPEETIISLRACCANHLYHRARILIRDKIGKFPITNLRDSSGNGLILTVLKSNSFASPQKLELLKLLLQGPHKDNVNQADKEGTTPLIWAANNEFEIAKYLLNYPNINVNLCDGQGNTALHYAASKNALKTTQALLAWHVEGKVSADPNIQNNSGETPLHLAKDFTITKLLINWKANPYLRDKYGQTPLGRARSSSKIAIAKFLKECVWHEKVFKKLSNHDISAKEIIGVLSENSTIKGLYDKSAGVVEGYTVGQHTTMVLELAQRYRLCLQPQISEFIEWSHFLLFLSLHDIGKGVSKEIVPHRASAKEVELEANRKVATWTLEQLRVRSHIGHIFQALLMYDSQGDYLKGNITVDSFKTHLLDMAAVSNLAPRAFYQIYTIFHLLDAASYPNLQPLFVFEKESLRHCEGNQSLIDNLYRML